MDIAGSDETTEGIHVVVESIYVEERSNPAADHYFFAYHIVIANEGDETAQLMSRHWVITDGDGKVEHVRGPGVVGEQPRLEPGQAFKYTSFCPLTTPVGTMHGTFQMIRDDGQSFDAVVAPFTLAMPTTLH